jgi:hypothetical protein
MAELHGKLSRSRDLELEGRTYQVWIRRLILALMLAISVVAVLNVFGQRSSTSVAAAPAATLTVDAPERLRGGLIFEARIDIDAHRTLHRPRLVFDRGWSEGMTHNTTDPEPQDERSGDGRLVLGYAPIHPGGPFTVWTQWQVNPVNVGNRPQDVALYDGPTRIASVNRTVTVFP